MRTRAERWFWVEAGLSVLAGALAVLTLVWHDWFEWFGFDPDHGSGAFEWTVVVVCAVASVTLGWRAGARYVAQIDPG
jgi:hypothetical protein